MSSQVRRHLLVFVVAVVLHVALLAVSAASDWPMFRRDATHTAQTVDDGSAEDHLTWSYRVTPPPTWEGPLIWSSPVVADSRVYFTSRDGRFWCLDLATGDSLWAVTVGSGDPLTSTPAISSGLAYFLSGGYTDRCLYCYSAQTGQCCWSSEELGSQWAWPDPPGSQHAWFESSPVIDTANGVAYVGARDGKMYCVWISGVNKGDIKWESDVLGEFISSSPALHDGRVFVGATRRTPAMSGVHCLMADHGNLVWSYDYVNGNGGGTLSSPTIAHGRIYIGANEDCLQGDQEQFGGKMLCLYWNGGVLWEQPIVCDVRACPLVLGDSVYISTGHGLYCFDADTGEYILGEDGGVQPGGTLEWYSSFAAAQIEDPLETFLYIGEGGLTEGTGRIWCLDPCLEEVWRFTTPDGVDCWSSPAIAAGRVLMCSNSGRVFCFRQVGKARMMPPSCPIGGYGQREMPCVKSLRGGSPGVEEEIKVCCLAGSGPGSLRVRYGVGVDASDELQLGLFDVMGRVVWTSPVTPVSGRGSVDWKGVYGLQSASGVLYWRLRCGGVQRSGSLLRMQ